MILEAVQVEASLPSLPIDPAVKSSCLCCKLIEYCTTYTRSPYVVHKTPNLRVRLVSAFVIILKEWVLIEHEQDSLFPLVFSKTTTAPTNLSHREVAYP